MQPPKLVLVAATTGYQTRSFASAGPRLGISVYLATDRCHVMEDPWADRAIPIQFDAPAQSAAEICRACPDANGIVAVADAPTLVASMVAQQLGIPFHPPGAVRICRDKHLLRQSFQAAGLPVPPHILLPAFADGANGADGQEAEREKLLGRLGYPIVLKPLGLSASRGVVRADSFQEAEAAFARIRHILQARDVAHKSEERDRYIQAESYIPGREFALEGLMTGGRLIPLALFDKPDPLEGPFFEETIYVTPSREAEDLQAKILATAARAAAAVGLTDGPIHAEMRVNGAGIWMLEIAARPIGGLCARALRFTSADALGVTLEELVILHAIGRMPRALVLAAPASGVMMIPVPRAGVFQAVSGEEEALATPGIRELIVTAKPGQRLVPLPEGASYTGFLFAEGDTPDAVERSLRAAHSCLRFRILQALDVLSA